MLKDDLFLLFCFVCFVFTARVRSTREGNVFSLSVSPHLGGGGVSTFPGPGGGGGTYSQVWMGGVPTFPGPGGVPTQVWIGGGGTYSGLDGGVPT